MSWLRKSWPGRLVVVLILAAVLVVDYLVFPRPVRRALAWIGRRRA